MKFKKNSFKVTALATALAIVLTTVFSILPVNMMNVYAATDTNKKEIVTYFANWNLGSKDANAGGEVGSIPWESVTYINHAFWGIKPNDGTQLTTVEWKSAGNTDARTAFTIYSTSPEADVNHFAQYEYYSNIYPDVNVMISIGGWTDCGYFSEMAYTAEGRKSFIDSCVSLMKDNPWIDGIDLDWEYPGKERSADDEYDEGCPVFGTAAQDEVNFVSLLAEMTAAFDAEFGTDAKKITACSGSGDYRTYWKDASEYLDIINIMTYDLAGPWNTATGHTSPITAVKGDIAYLTGIGIDSQKINIGTPFYCYVWEIANPNPDLMNLVGQAATSNQSVGESLGQRDFNQFASEAVDFTVVTSSETKTAAINGKTAGEAGWHLYYDATAGAAYMYNNDTSSQYEGMFITYESNDSLHDKIEVIHENNLSGIIIWVASDDDLANGAPMFTYLSDNLWNYQGATEPEIDADAGNEGDEDNSTDEDTDDNTGDSTDDGTGDSTTGNTGNNTGSNTGNVSSGFVVSDTSGTADIMNVSVGGTASDHGYKITDMEGLIHFAECVNSGVSFAGRTVTLAGDIDFNPGVTLLDENHELLSSVDLSSLYMFPGIGTKEHAFDGIFDGNGYVIKGLYMDSENNAYDDGGSYDCTALFNIVDNATLKNIGIMDSYIRLSSGYGAGLLADTGYSIGKTTTEKSTVTNCFFVGQVDASGNDENWVGGLVGFFGTSSTNAGEITNCYADALVKSASTKRLGIIVGQNYGSIGNCYVTGGSIVAPNGEKEMTAVQGRQGTALEEQPSYAVKGIINGPEAVVTLGNTTTSNYIVLETAEEVKDLVINQCFLSVADGTYAIGKGIPTVDANGNVTYSNNYRELVRTAIVNEKFDTLPNCSTNLPEDDGYFGSDEHPSFMDYRIVTDPTDASNKCMAVTANSRRCQLLLQYAASDIPEDSTLSFRFYVPEGSSVGSGINSEDYGVANVLQEVQSVSPDANYDQVMYIKTVNDNGDIVNETEFTQGKWINVTCSLGSFTDGNIVLNFWKSIYNEGDKETADAFMATIFDNQDLYIDDFKIIGKVDKDSVAENQADEPKEPSLPLGAEDNSYTYSWEISENGIKGLPEIVTDGSRTNVTDELKAALQTAINTEDFFKPAKNVILMIGDGMGINPVTASEKWYGELIMNDLPNQGAAMTKSYTSTFADDFTSRFSDNVDVSDALRITDSAAGGTAIACGYKTYYYSIATGTEGAILKSLADVKNEQNGAVGIVTNGWISDATPAVFLSHSIKRGVDDAEANRLAYGQDYLQTQMFDFAPELLIGQASEGEIIDQEFDKSENDRFIAENSMGISSNWNSYLNLESEHNVYISREAFGYDLDASAYEDVPNMSQVTAQALEQLDEQAGDEGFFVMIEDGEIDLDGHNNLRDDQLQEIQNFDEAVAIAVKYVLENPDTILLVTADHDTGGMTLKDGWNSYMNKCSYTTSGHSENNVPVYAIGYGTEIFDGQVYQNNYTGRILGNLMGDIGFGDYNNDPMVILDGGLYANNTVAALVDTDKAIGESSNTLETNNVLTKDQKDAAIASATTVLFVPPTMDDTDASVVKAGDKLAEIASPIATDGNVEFTGWYKNEACTVLWDFNNDVVSDDGDTVLYAGWKTAGSSEDGDDSGEEGDADSGSFDEDNSDDESTDDVEYATINQTYESLPTIVSSRSTSDEIGTWAFGVSSSGPSHISSYRLSSTNGGSFKLTPYAGRYTIDLYVRIADCSEDASLSFDTRVNSSSTIESIKIIEVLDNNGDVVKSILPDNAEIAMTTSFQTISTEGLGASDGWIHIRYYANGATTSDGIYIDNFLVQ